MSSTSTPSPAPERETYILGIGQQCSASLCHLVDFLPFKCQHCGQAFCGDHFLPNQHKCDKYDETKHNRVAPPCPFCSTPIAIPPGQDPNIRMERHFNTDCSVLTGKTAKSSAPRCAKAKCNKVLFSPIQCDTCKQQYCAQHRFPKDHICSTTSAKAPTSASQSTSATANAALAAIKRAANNSGRTTASPAPTRAPPKPKAAAAPAKQPPAVKGSTSNQSSVPNLFSKTDRRAKAERESKLKAMRERAKKGLLSEEEKLILATEEAEAAAAAKERGDCIIA